jgi:hypothetical protein
MKPVSALNVVEFGSVGNPVDGKPTVMVEPAVNAPVGEGVKPIVHAVGLLTTVEFALKVTPAGSVAATIAEGATSGLIGEAESDEVSSE